jgi:hypothetical protein
MTTTRAVLLSAGAWPLAAGSQATVEMEVQGGKLGFPAANCL